MRKLLFLVSIWMLIAILGDAGQENQNQDIAKTVEALKQIKVDENTTVPEAARPLLTTFKHQFRNLIQQSLNVYASETKDIAKAKTGVASELQKQNVSGGRAQSRSTDKDEEKPFVYGEDIGFSIDGLNNHPDMVAATTTIGVCCGHDTSLYLFKKNGQRWNLILTQESNGYADVSGAQGRFGYAVSPSDAQGHFFVVTKNINPWCTSNWQQIRYRALRPGPTANAPRVLLKQNDTIYLGEGTDGSITVKPDGFTIEFVGGQELDAGVLTREHFVTYKVNGNRVSRIAPLAKEPEGFLDEWFNLPWNDASKWIAGTALADISNWHARMHTERVDAESDRFYSTFAYDPPACRMSDKQWQIGLKFEAPEGKNLPLGMPSKIYFTIGQTNSGNYIIKDVSKTGARKCKK